MDAMAIEDLLHPFLGRYMDSPRWLRASAGRAYSWLPPRVRLGSHYQRFHREVQERDAAALARIATRKLAETLRCAFESVPAYEHFRGLAAGHRDPHEVLAELPVTDKLDIKHHPERYISSAMPASARLEMFTGGSTRNPMRFYLHKHVTRPKEFAYIQDFRRRLGVPAGEMILALRGRTVPSAAQPGGAICMVEPIKRQLILSSDLLE